jgi:hypothetical protein
MTDPTAPTVTYFAISAANSKTIRTNAAILLGALVPLLALPEVVALMSPRVLLFSIAGTAIANLILRWLTIRPIALVAPGDVKAVPVPRIDPPTEATD